MASKIGRLIDDQSKDSSVMGKEDAFKTLRKGELGGTKPLNDLSNSGKPATQASKKQPSKNLAPRASSLGKVDASKTQTRGLGVRKPLRDLSNAGKPLIHAPKKLPSKSIAFIEEVTHATNSAHNAGMKKGFFKGLDKGQTHTRKALLDISNSVKPQQQKHDTKLKFVAEEPLCPSAVENEGFLHDHQECIKAQNNAVDMDQLLMPVSEFKPECPLRSKHLEKMSDKLDSPPPIFESPKYYTPCEHFDELSGKLDFLLKDETDSPWISEDSDFKLM